MLTYSTDLQLHNSVFQTDTEGTAKTVKRFCYWRSRSDICLLFTADSADIDYHFIYFFTKKILSVDEMYI